NGYAMNASRNRTPGLSMSQLKTPSRSSTPCSVNGRPATGRASDAGRTAIRLLRFVDLLQLRRGGGDDVLGRVAPARLREHVDQHVLGDALRQRVAGRPRPSVQPRRLERLLVRQVARLGVPHRMVVVRGEERRIVR